MDDIYDNIDDYNPSRKKKLILFDDMIADIMTNKKFQAIIKELFIRCKVILFIRSYFYVPKRSQIKFYTLLNNEHSQQKRAPKYCYELFSR